MKLSYDEIFKHTDVLNPISSATLFRAGKLAELEPNKVVLDLGSGKGFPSILWATLFGIEVEGYDSDSGFVQYANSHAELLNLSHRVKFHCKDIKELKVSREYDIVAFLGLGMVHIFRDIHEGFKQLRTMLCEGGFLMLAEPISLTKDVPLDILESLNVAREDFLTKDELQQVMEQSGFQAKGSFDSSKEDWEFYIRPVNYAMSEVIRSTSKLTEEAQMVIKHFNAVNQYWNMVLWVAKAI